ncbi:hypothetical protein N665_0087s0023, partial [Sinapis alba]
ILSCVPPRPLVRFKTVCKQWNTLFDDNTFINNHKMTLNPEIEVLELTLDIPGLKDQKPNDLVDCNGCIQSDHVNQPSFKYLGIGYDHNTVYKKIVYKTLAAGTTTVWIRIFDFDTDAWKDEEAKHETTGGTNLIYLHSTRGVSLNGNFYYLCNLPCAKKDHSDALVLNVFRGDRFSLLKQFHVTKKIQIWVAKDKIGVQSRKKVKWRSFMEVSIPNLPDLVQTQSYHQPSYFIDHKRGSKRLVVCSCDVDGRAWIYVVGENKLISKTRLDSAVDPWPLHCTCIPSLVMVPGSKVPF